jgi:hypothetical protein
LHSAGSDCTHGKLRVARHTQLAHDKDIEREMQGGGYLISYRHATSRKGEHDDVVSVGIFPETFGQNMAGVPTVPK